MNEIALTTTSTGDVAFDAASIDGFIEKIRNVAAAVEAGEDGYDDRKSLMSVRSDANKIVSEMKSRIKQYETTVFANARSQVKMIEAELDALGAAVKKRMAEIDAIYNAEKSALIETAFNQTMTYYDFTVDVGLVSDVRWWNRSVSEKTIREQLVARLNSIQVLLNMGVDIDEAVPDLISDKWDLARVIKKIQKTSEDEESLSSEKTLSALITIPINDQYALEKMVADQIGWSLEWKE